MMFYIKDLENGNKTGDTLDNWPVNVDYVDDIGENNKNARTSNLK